MGRIHNGELANVIKVLTILLLSLSGLQAQTTEPQCARGEFSAEARQGQPFSGELRGGIEFSVLRMRLEEDPKWAWFQIGVIGGDQGGFVFNPSDRNWLLATDFWSAFIGGADSDLEAALQYRLRYFVFPISVDGKQELLKAADTLKSAKTRGAIGEGLKVLRTIPLGLIRFEITDYRFGEGESPTSVDWLKFTVDVAFPPEFSRLGPLLTTNAECPAIPDEVFENIRSPERHKYVLSLH